MNNKITSFLSRFKLHFVFWTLVILFFLSLNLSSSAHSTFIDIVKSLVEFIITSSILVYINLNIFIPRLFYERKYFQYAFILLLFISLYALLVSYIEMYVLHYYDNLKDPDLFRHLFISNLVIFILLVVITTTLKLSKKWYQSRAEMQRLRLEKLETELQFLRTQINPHFLFNTLNNIYSLILSKENEKAGGMILKLSGIMDYMIHDSKEETVPLQTEINHIRNYLDLEKIRLIGQDHVDFISETDKADYRIAPYILFPFIENGFKHGISNTIHNGFIKIGVNASNGILKFQVENSKPSNSDNDMNNGIGLSNIKRRLEIIYPGKHELEILDNSFSYHVNLTIQLNEHAKNITLSENIIQKTFDKF